ncbi:GNAT family protein [Paenibacillus qinlingensis]|uniref:RimJ/RimL family protein N-acetyltransferase n=1 Tax=Paenibacillus qinlingensis TaxID=1837343 RepID=A0ABU1P2B3_9BACL|nr:GNAT family protein [Paenibacillus qinlingensis]MDR6553890.1 RimJ/RimL family protein N-acetyltransferase [Paenibacillus qinlingensis]
MLKKRDLHDCHSLFNLMTDPSVFPYVRNKCQCYEEYLFITKQLIVEEEKETCISRTILNEMGHPIGTIELYNIVNRTGFLATWIGAPYFGKGYNQQAKETFFTELFLENKIDTIFLKIRKQNIRSKKAVEKLPYALLANDTNPHIYQSINHNQAIYDLYKVERLCYLESSKVMQHEVAT